MNINIYYGIEGAKQAHGLVVIIDIFRAATVEAYLLGKGAKYILPVSTKEEAFNYKLQNPNYILVGEMNGLKIEGFDIGNSPLEINSQNIMDKIAVHRSSQGTQGLINALNASEIIFGSFVIHSAVKNYIFKKNPEYISLVAMDGEGSEDYEYAYYLKNELLGKKTNIDTIIKRIVPKASRFLDPDMPEFPREDFDLCLKLDKFSFICSVKKENNIFKTVKKYL